MSMNEQQRLLSVIWSDDPTLLATSGFDAKGVEIYRRNLLANSQRALSITFPTIFKLLDSDISENLVKQFLLLCPPDQGDWSQWGEEFPHFIATHQVAHDYPYLADCAALDWYYHCALHGSDQMLEQSSLALLGDTDPEKIVVRFNKNVALIKTKYPIADIFAAHHDSDELQRDRALKRAQLLLSTTQDEEVVMVFRPEFQPKVATLTPSEAEFICCLDAGESLATALDTVSQYSDFSFEKWLLTGIENNLIHQFNSK